MKRKQYDTYGMSGEGFAGASAGAGARGPFPGASYSGKYLCQLAYLFLSVCHHIELIG